MKNRRIAASLLNDVGLLVLLALARILFQVFTNGQYGFHQDELVTLDAATHHLAWGYVAWPPVTPFLARVAYDLFGVSVIGLRAFAVLAEGLVMLLTGWMVRDLGGSRWAQILAVVAVATTPISIIQGGLFQYETLDYLCWVLLAFTVVRLLKTENPRWWLAIGAAIGLGMMTKYTIAFSVVGLIAGILATRSRRTVSVPSTAPERCGGTVQVPLTASERCGGTVQVPLTALEKCGRYLKSVVNGPGQFPWMLAGALLALLIWLPNLIWQMQNHWITLNFLASIHARDVGAGQTSAFLTDQLLFNLNPVMLLLVIAGLYFFLVKQGQRYRLLGWMYIVPLVLLLVAQGKGYYLAAAYPMLAAGGAVWWEQRLTRMLNQRGACAWRWVTWSVLSAFALLFIATELPVAPLGSPWWDVVSKSNAELKSEVGWPELAQQVAQVYDALPAVEKPHTAILAASSGEIGSINLYGPAYGLPRAISGFDSYWQYGYGTPPPQTVIVLGFSSDLLAYFEDCTLIAPIRVPFNVQNEEAVDHNAIHLCHHLRIPWPQFWKGFQYFG
jgi:hypothetical protein